jgi:hypothetical protein
MKRIFGNYTPKSICISVVAVQLVLVFWVQPYYGILPSLIMLAAYICVSAYIFWKAVYMTFHKRWIVGPMLILFGVGFWDLMPMEIMYGYYCYNKAETVTHKTVDQWKSENPNVLEHLIPKNLNLSNQKNWQSFTHDGIEYRGYLINERFCYRYNKEKHLFGIIETHASIVDTQTQEPIVSMSEFDTDAPSFGSGGGSLLSVIWYKGGGCNNTGNLVTLSKTLRERLRTSSRYFLNTEQALKGGANK